jgi:hypothetical protein
MTSGTWTTQHFTCPNKDCGTIYTATREQHPEQHEGDFNCLDCGKQVHAWSGIYGFFDRRSKGCGPPSLGKRSSDGHAPQTPSLAPGARAPVTDQRRRAIIPLGRALCWPYGWVCLVCGKVGGSIPSSPTTWKYTDILPGWNTGGPGRILAAWKNSSLYRSWPQLLSLQRSMRCRLGRARAADEPPNALGTPTGRAPHACTPRANLGTVFAGSSRGF